MVRYVVQRILMMIPVVLGVMLIVFFFQSISPDDPVDQIVGTEVSEEVREATREELGLNDPIIVQFVRYVWNFVSTGSLGVSYKSGQPVTQELMLRFPVTIRLAIISVFLGVLIGIPLGVWSAVRQYTLVDRSILVLSVLSAAMPSFWFALILISLFSVRLGWFPSSGIQSWKSWIMPTVVVAVAAMANMTRTTRSSMLETLRQDYVRTARAKGQKEFVITTRHILRNSLIPVVTAIGGNIGVQLGGALVVESIFGIPGIGKYAVDAISARNYPAVLGSVVILAITFSVVNLLVDLTYTFIDPRIKTTFASAPRKKLRSGASKSAAEG